MAADYGCTHCGWLGDDVDRDDHYPVCPECGEIVQVYKDTTPTRSEPADFGGGDSTGVQDL